MPYLSPHLTPYTIHSSLPPYSPRSHNPKALSIAPLTLAKTPPTVSPTTSPPSFTANPLTASIRSKARFKLAAKAANSFFRALERVAGER